MNHGRQSKSKYAQKLVERAKGRGMLAERKASIAELESIELAREQGLERVPLKTAKALQKHHVPIRKGPWNGKGRVGTHSDLHFAPASCAKLIKAWEEAQVFAGPAGKISEFRKLKFETVVKLAADEWHDLNPSTNIFEPLIGQTVTGRFSSGPSLQNPPRTRESLK